MTIRFIPISQVRIPDNRQRRNFDPAQLNELADSIESIGLLHPPVLRQEGATLVLVAGERRFRAIQDLHDLGRKFSCGTQLVPDGMLPYNPLGELSPLQAMEAELDENIRRQDLSWQERAMAVAKLAQLRNAQASDAGLPTPSVADIALEVRGSKEGVNQETTRRELILAKHLDDPDVQSAKTVNDAFKVLRRKEESNKNAALAEAVGRTFNSSAHTLVNGDSLVWMVDAPANQFDVILTDPPYGMGADDFGDSGGHAAGGHAYEDTRERALDCYQTLAVEGFRITKPDAHLYAFCDLDLFLTLRALFADAGWRVFRTPLIWFKPSAYRAPWPEHGPQRKYETILYAVKGDRKCLRLGGDVISCPPDDNLGHQAQKPVPLLDDLLRRSARPGDTILDPFCGSGSIFPAAHALKLRATGIELDQAHYGLAAKRLQALES